ncbi:hypothetical protein Agub_g8628, partial [Astrephomene gubernaculifera]
MNRLSDTDSEDDSREDADRPRGTFVLRPAITSLPSIIVDHDTEDDSSSSDTEVVFSSINWSAQESTGLEEAISPGGLRTWPAPPASGVPRPAGGNVVPTRPVTAAADASGSSGIAAGEPKEYDSARSPAQTRNTGGPSGQPTASTPPQPAANGGGAYATDRTKAAELPDADDEDEDDDEEEEEHDAGSLQLYEGRGWLSGAAGRLANVTERKRAAAAATDAEQVAAAARDAAALRLHLQQQRMQQQQQGRQEGGEGQQQLQEEPQGARAAGAAAAGSMVEGTEGNAAGVTDQAAIAVGAAAAANGVAVEKQRDQVVEEEQRIARDFHEAILAAEAEPPLVAPSDLSLHLDAPVAGLGLDDLDALIARLAAGAADLAAPGPAAPPAAAAGAGAAGSDGASGGLWALELPAADSLWSDEEGEDAGRAEPFARQPVQPATSAAATAAAVAVGEAGAATAAATVAPGRSPVTGAAGMAAPVVSAAPAPMLVASTGPAPMPSPSPSSSLPAPLPAKFKFFAAPPPQGSQPGAMPPLPPAPPMLPTGSASVNPSGGGAGPVVLDLRQSIAEVVQRSSREVASAAAQRESEAKAAAARRRLVDSSDDDDDVSGDDGGGGGGGKARPVPPPPAPEARPPVNHAAVGTDADAVISIGSARQQGAASAVQPRTARPPVATVPAAAAATGNSLPSSAASAAVGSDGGGATAVAAKPSSSVGTDCADLRPTSRSVFVCTADRAAEEEERARDIREYLRARSAAAAAAAAAEQQRQRDAAAAAAASAAERRWPEPPLEVAQRVSTLATQQQRMAAETTSVVAATVAAAAAAASNGSQPKSRRVVTFAGGHGGALSDSSVTSASILPSTTSNVSNNASSCAGTAQKGHQPLAAAANTGSGSADGSSSSSPSTDAAVSRAFAGCSTEGDEAWLAEPAAASVVDAKLERGSRMAAAGTVIPLRNQSRNQPPAAFSNSNAAASKLEDGLAGSTSAAGPATAQAKTQAAAPAATATATAPISATAELSDGPSRPSALQLPSPTDQPSPRHPSAPTRPAPKSPAGGSPAGSAPRGAAAASLPTDLGRLPAWLPPDSCFTLLITSPSNLPSLEVGAVLEWLLRASSPSQRSSPSSASASCSLPAFSLVGVRLLGVPPSWPLLPPAAAASSPAASPSATAKPVSVSSSSAAAATSGEVRVLAVACVPRAGLDADLYNHEPPAAAEAASAARELASALAAVPLSEVLRSASSPSAVGREGGAVTPAAAAASKQQLAAWVRVLPGSQQLFGPLRLGPHALSQHLSQHPRTSASGGAPSPGSHAAAAAGAAPAGTFLCMVTSGVLQHAHLLSGLLGRAACLGLTLTGLQVLYASEEGTAAIVSSTPHRPLPYTGAAVLSLYGGNEPLRRWQAQLGPPEARLAARTDPTSLHALYGDVARQITCSYDSAAAVREVSALFYGSSAGGGDGEPTGTPPASPQSHSSGAATAAAAVAGCGLVSGGPAQTQWLALPSCGAAQQAQALWCAQHLLWCGFGVRGLLLSQLPPGASPTASQPQQSRPALLLELRKEEAVEQLPVLLSSLPPPPTSAPASAAALSPPPATISLLAPDVRLLPSDFHSLPQPHVASELLDRSCGTAASTVWSSLHPSSSSSMAASQQAAPQQHHEEDGIAVVALQARQLHAAALVLAALAAHVTTCANANANVSGGVGACAVQQQQTPPPARLELVACRLLRQVPSDVAGCLAVLPSQATVPASAAGSGGASSATSASSSNGPMGQGGRPAQRLVISQPALLAVFHGPSAQERVVRLLQAATQRLQSSGLAAAVAAPAAASGGGGGSNSDDPDGVTWLAVLDKMLRQYYPTTAAATTAPPPLLLAAVSGSQESAKRALAHAFGAGHVFLDAAFHDGVHRPPLPLSSSCNTSAAASAAAAADLSPLQRLLSGPESLPAVVALDLPALHRNLLPRLLKQLWREGYCLHAAATCVVQPGGAAAAAMPELAGKPAVLLYVSRSNAVLHVRALAAALTAAAAGPAGVVSSLGSLVGSTAAAASVSNGGGLYTCTTWHEAAAVVSETWPASSSAAACAALPVPAGSAGAASSSAGGLLQPGAAPGAPQRRFVRPDGSRLLQLTAMVVTPSAAAAQGGSSGSSPAAPLLLPPLGPAPSLDWPRLADMLEGLHAEGFRLAAVRAVAAHPRDVADLGRASCRISQPQQQALHASASAAAAAAATAAAAASTVAAGDAKGCTTSAAATLPPPSNLVMLALARDNAVTSLQILLDEA